MKYVTWIVVIVVLIWAGWAIFNRTPAPDTNTPVVETGPIKIGVLAPLTGDGAAYGEPFRNVLEIAIGEVNAAGGVNGRMFEVVYEDDQCESTAAVSAAQKLINVDGIKVIIGSICSSATIPVAPVAQAANVFLFSPGASSPDLTGISPLFARDYPSDSSQGAVLADVAYTKMSWKKVAFIQETKDYPLGIFKAFDTKFTELGGTTVKEEFAADATDFRTQLTKLKAASADALFVDVQTPAAAGRIIKQLQDLKWSPKILLSDAAIGDTKLVSDNSKFLEGALGAEFSTSGNIKYQNLATAYKAKFGVDMPFASYGQTEYDTVYILADGIKAVGYDGVKLAQWVRTVKGWEGASGMVTIGADGDRIGGHTAKIVKAGKVEVLQ